MQIALQMEKEQEDPGTKGNQTHIPLAQPTKS
jgi:hypothetical protein